MSERMPFKFASVMYCHHVLKAGAAIVLSPSPRSPARLTSLALLSLPLPQLLGAALRPLHILLFTLLGAALRPLLFLPLRAPLHSLTSPFTPEFILPRSGLALALQVRDAEFLLHCLVPPSLPHSLTPSLTHSACLFLSFSLSPCLWICLSLPRFSPSSHPLSLSPSSLLPHFPSCSSHTGAAGGGNGVWPKGPSQEL
eukprot:2782162-Rhodomonas_salina.1